ncbi:MAG: hypothetical protein ABSA26_07250 [Thermoguttaceae bacterium]|jgi:hypothetical protein
MIPKTKQAAREADYLTVHAALSWCLVPRLDAKPTIVKGEEFFRLDQCEEIISYTEAKHRRLRIPLDAKPITTLHARICGKSVFYAVYRVSDCVPMRAFKDIPATEIDLLLATFTVNKAAKRYRDSAQSNYYYGQHGFARYAKHTKENLYMLKNKGIAEAYRQGRLSFIGTHGNMGLYRGEEYCFHSTLIPVSYELVDGQQDSVFVEAVPKETKEGRLKDAVHTLQALVDDMMGFHKLPPPIRVRVREEEVGVYWPSENDYDEDEEERFFATLTPTWPTLVENPWG